MNLNYIGHNQWEWENFKNFCHSAIDKNWDKIILFCHQEYAWHVHNSKYFALLYNHCKTTNQKIHVTVGSAEYLYPHHFVKYDINQFNISYWPIYWMIRSYRQLIDCKNSPIDLGKQQDYKYHFISMNHTAYKHRLLMIDLLAKANLIEKNALSVHKQNTILYQWKYFNFNKKCLDESFVNQTTSQHHLPSQYYESFCNLISETSSNYIFLSEKTAHALIIGKPFLISGHFHMHKFLKTLGFELYDEIFDYSFDEIIDLEKRNEKLIENFIELDKIPLRQLNDLHRKIIPKIMHNKNRVRELIYDVNNYPVLVQEVMEQYVNTGQVIEKTIIEDCIGIQKYKNFLF